MKTLPKLILTDIDGVWTDGGMYYGTNGVELKKFHTYDSAGVLFCKTMGIEIGIITGENIEIVKRRADKLNIKHCFLGVKDKIAVAEQLISELNCTWQDVAYLGDDINDMALLQKVGYAGVVANAPEYVKEYAHYITLKKGGEGAFREFVEHILSYHNLLEKAIAQSYLKNQ